jgi:purine-nucleoside phosphorylase
MAEIARPIQTLAQLGARTLLVTSAVGSVTSEFAAGTLVLVRDHINLVQTNPLIGLNKKVVGPQYLDLLRAYSPRLRAALQDRLAREVGQTLPEAVLAFLSGPCFETESELRWLRVVGADLVGWSLVPEVIAAVHAGLDVLAFALVTDFSHTANVNRIDVDRIFKIGASHKSEHLPVFEAGLGVIESSLIQVAHI